MSIKNKFATAVATASLLAGLFGSAFVPSAMGAVILPADTVIPKYTTLTEEGGMQQAGTAKSFGFQTADAYDNDGASSVAIGINLFSAGSAGVGTTQYDLTSAINDEVILKAVSSNSNIELGWAYETDGTEEDCGDTDVDANFAASASVVDVAAADGAGDYGPDVYYLCFAAKASTTAATSTITVTVDGIVATTFSVTAVGPIASLTASITDGYKYLAEDNDYLEEWLTIIAKDAAGVQINGSASTVSNEQITLSDWADNPDNTYGDQMGFFDTSMSGDQIGSGTAYVGYDVDNDVCYSDSGEDDGDAGKSYTLKVEDASGDVVSNGITITCTLGSDGARVTALNPEATSASGSPNAGSGLTYDETAAGSDDSLALFATVVDEDGAPLGDGAAPVDFDWSFSGDATLDYSSGWDTARVFGGVATVAFLQPDTTRFGRFTYVVTANDSDLAITAAGDDAVAKAFTKTFTAINTATAATITKVRNAAKTTAVFTADMGEDAAFDVVSFTVELKNGNVVVYDRRANANGVAKLTLSKRNTTIYVYASYLSDTNVMKCVFR